ncbi:MAG: hypothetical protein H8E44_28110 [Planctomycetes bacterium]|nr:hypothetical protein [Planctomycetota bacterium]MBL7043612.1 hypothetical protein [Pirellulaceae bacterium]
MSGCDRGPSDVRHDVSDVNAEFGVFWPPWNLDRSLSTSGEPLLQGELSVFEAETGPSNAFGMHVTLLRPHGEPDRIRWNKRLAFPEYSWMAEVRVWDRNREWLWPNLPYLLRAHGEERVERYGGVDPVKGVDNDFAAVLIRPLEHESSEIEQQEPAKLPQPLVSAEWHSVNAEKVDRESVVHIARSDDFIVRLLPSGRQSESGRLGVWLIYADFLGEITSRNWPANGEYNGGILAYFEISWRRSSDGEFEFDTEHLIPPTDTGFDWANWATGPSALEKGLELTYPSERSE